MKTKKIIFYFIIISAIIFVVLFAHLFLRNHPRDGEFKQAEKSSIITATSSEASNNIQAVRIKQKESEEYRNVARGFSLSYPKELLVKEYDEGDGTYTIVFESKTGEKGFQIFFTPYKETEIKKSRILKDVPSGKFTEPVEVVIGGGIRALAFFSEGNLGRMREVWFLHNGYLYEATAYANLDEWLSGIMKSWTFNR